MIGCDKRFFMNDLQFLNKALKILSKPLNGRKHSWGKRDYRNHKTGCMCVGGAGIMAEEGTIDTLEYPGARRMARLLGFTNTTSMFQWNDDKSRRFSHVKNRIKTAISELKSSAK